MKNHLVRFVSILVIASGLGVFSGCAGTPTKESTGEDIDDTAITAKVFVRGGNALDFGLGFGGWGYYWCTDANNHSYRCSDVHHDISIHADYLYQEKLVNMTNRLDWYAGFGGRVIMSAYGNNNLAHDVVVIARIPIGIAASFSRPGFLEAYLEIVPGIAVFPLGFNIDFGLGVRAYF